MGFMKRIKISLGSFDRAAVNTDWYFEDHWKGVRVVRVTVIMNYI